MKTIALVEKYKDGMFEIYTPYLKNKIIGNGKTIKAAKLDFENSFIKIKDTFIEKGEKLPKELHGLTFNYKLER